MISTTQSSIDRPRPGGGEEACEKLLRESEMFIAEQRKLLAEDMKLAAEQTNLTSEARKLDRDHWLAPWSLIIVRASFSPGGA